MTTTQDDIPWDRIGLLLAGGLPVEEAAELRGWMNADPSRQAVLASMEELWAITEPGDPSRDADQVLAELRRRDATTVHELAAHPRFVGAPTAADRRPWRRALVAAAVACIVAGGWWLVQTTSRSAGGPAAVATAGKEYATGRGQRLTVNLPDGTAVMLGPSSVIRYAADYGRGARTVELKGEAFFDVTHDAARPFAVRAGRAVARDLGTKFVVRARDGEASVDVIVAEGRVALGTAGEGARDSVVLDPRDFGRVGASGPATMRRGVALDRYFGWTEGRLVFEATPLAVVVAELSRWYDADVTFEGAELADRQVTATFHNEPIAKVVPMIQASLGLELRHSGRRYVLTAR